MPCRKWQGEARDSEGLDRLGDRLANAARCWDMCTIATDGRGPAGDKARQWGDMGCWECASHCLDSEGPFGYIQRLDGEARRLVF